MSDSRCLRGDRPGNLTPGNETTAPPNQADETHGDPAQRKPAPTTSDPTTHALDSVENVGYVSFGGGAHFKNGKLVVPDGWTEW